MLGVRRRARELLEEERREQWRLLEGSSGAHPGCLGGLGGGPGGRSGEGLVGFDHLSSRKTATPMAVMTRSTTPTVVRTSVLITSLPENMK